MSAPSFIGNKKTSPTNATSCRLPTFVIFPCQQIINLKNFNKTYNFSTS